MIASLAVAALVVSLIPVLAGSFYAHPITDDFKFSRFVHPAVRSSGISSVLSNVFYTVSDVYMSWQGTFSAIFIFALMPEAIFSGTYFLTTFIIVGSLVASTFFFFHTVIRRVFGSKTVFAVILASLTLLLQIQFIPDKFEGLYWYNGATYYSLFYSFMLVFFALLLRFDKISKRGAKIAVGAVLILLAVLIGGGNYTTSLVSVLLTVFFVAVCFVKKKRCLPFYCVVLAALLTAFAISVLAPGNAVRAADSEGMNPLIAIVKSLYSAASVAASWTRVPQIALFVFSSPIVYMIARKVNLSFRYPLLVFALSFGVFAAQMTPPLSALSTIGSGRQQNIYYYAYFIFVYSQMFYFFGWFQRKTGFADRFGIKDLLRRYYIIFLALFVLVSFAGCITYPIRDMTSVDVAVSLYKGEAQTYDKEYKDIEKTLNEGGEICRIPEIKTVPDYLSELKISEDDDYWVNIRMAHYFSVDKIIKTK